MKTIIREEPVVRDEGSSIGFFLGMLILVLFFIMLFVYGVPYIRNNMSGGSPQITIPDKIDVNVNK